MNSGINNVLQQIYEHLPLFAEEGGHNTTLDVNEFINNISGTDVNSTVLLVQRVFVLLGVLDLNNLQHGSWRFVSFPASLLARSALQSLADTDQSLFEPGFWNQQDSNSPISDKQRHILHSVESKRQSNHKHNAHAIRYVHVAWGLIVVDGKVLLRHREDKNRPNRNNYVLIGGRVSQNDLNTADQELSIQNSLAILQSPEASNSNAAIEAALKREIDEETGLRYETDYVYKLWRTVKPYTAVEGAGASHALTEYRIHIYHIDLTLDGLMGLSKRIKSDPYLVWFSLDEFAKAKTEDGKMAYLDALICDYKSREEWEGSVNNIPTSYHDYPASSSDAVTVPVRMGGDLLIGITGKESRIQVELDETEITALTSLALHAKGQAQSLNETDVRLLPSGWIEIENSAYQVSINSLIEKLKAVSYPIVEGFQENYFRLAVPPHNVYFEDCGFSYFISESPKTELEITRGRIQTKWVGSDPIIYSKNIKAGFQRGLENIQQGKDIDLSVMESLDKAIRRLGEHTRELGLRRIVRTINNKPCLAIRKIEPLD